VMEETQSGVWVRPGDPQEIAIKLLEALKRPTRNPVDVREQFAERYHYRNLAGQLSRWTAEACTRRS